MTSPFCITDLFFPIPSLLLAHSLTYPPTNPPYWEDLHRGFLFALFISHPFVIQLLDPIPPPKQKSVEWHAASLQLYKGCLCLCCHCCRFLVIFFFFFSLSLFLIQRREKKSPYLLFHTNTHIYARTHLFTHHLPNNNHTTTANTYFLIICKYG